jgi:DNA-binding GntR family transcriptional regulator
LSLPGRLKKSCSYHQQLIEAIEKRDEETAEKISKIIVEEAGQALITHLSSGKRFSTRDKDKAFL